MDTIRLGLIGCGGMMRAHVPAILSVPGLEVTALSDPSPDQIAMTRARDARLDAAGEFSDHASMLASGSVDAVLVSSPHTLHRQHVEDSFAAGCHVLCEKPLATTVEDCRALIEARDRSGKVGALAYQRHGQPVFRHIQELVASGSMGRVLMVNSSLAQDWLRLTKGSWRQDPGLSGGGQINDSGSHMIDILLWSLGLEADLVTSFMDFRGAKVDINSVVGITFAGGALGSLSIIGDAPIWQERHAVWLEEGCLLLDDGSLTAIQRNGVKTTFDFTSQASSPVTNFAAAIRGQAEVQAPFECGLRTIALTEAAWRSHAQHGAPVMVERVL